MPPSGQRVSFLNLNIQHSLRVARYDQLARADLEEQARYCAKIARKQRTMKGVRFQDYVPHLEIVFPRSKFLLGPENQVETVQHCGVRRRKNLRMKKIENVGDGWPKPLDAKVRQAKNLAQKLLFGFGRETVLQKCSEGSLVLFVLVDIRDAELRLPIKSMRSPFEDLFLFSDATEHELEGSPTKVIAELAVPNIGGHLLHASPNTTESLQPVGAVEEPRGVDGLAVLPVAVCDFNKRFWRGKWIVHSI